jgi:hypothetical protein
MKKHWKVAVEINGPFYSQQFRFSAEHAEVNGDRQYLVIDGLVIDSGDVNTFFDLESEG